MRFVWWSHTIGRSGDWDFEPHISIFPETPEEVEILQADDMDGVRGEHNGMPYVSITLKRQYHYDRTDAHDTKTAARYTENPMSFPIVVSGKVERSEQKDDSDAWERDMSARRLSAQHTQPDREQQEAALLEETPE